MSDAAATMVAQLATTLRPVITFVLFVRAILDRLMENPYMGDMIRFLFLGTVMEAGRKLAERASNQMTQFFVTKATFNQGDLAYDWVAYYLDSNKLWGKSNEFRVVARDAARMRDYRGSTGAVNYENKEVNNNGRPVPVYEPNGKTPEIFHWRGHWISVEKTSGTDYEYETGYELGGSLTLTVYAWNQSILRDLVDVARDHFDKSGKRPRMIEARYDPCGVALTAQFYSGDASYNWIHSWLMNKDLLQHTREVQVTTKQYATAWNLTADQGTASRVKFSPPTDARQLFRWEGIWVQATVRPVPSYNSNGDGGQITLVLHNSKHEKLVQLVEVARQEYLERSASKINVHMTDSYYSWNKMMTKSQRSMDTLILPEGVKESLLEDASEFLDSAEWYALTGVPHRRGYLLHGEPGTGKTSTIHALAGELGLEVYFISLAAPSLNDSSLTSLFAEVPSHSIVLLEDIDCAFPSRDPDDVESDDEDDMDLEIDRDPDATPDPPKAKEKTPKPPTGPPKGVRGGPKGKSGGKKTRRARNMIPPKSSVTLAGLLNVLDGVTSEEGRIVFATTNHIENLDPALIRPGRMDVKVQYNLATREQIIQTFLRFYPAGGHSFGSEQQRNPKRQQSLPKPRASSSLVQILQNKSRRYHHGLEQLELDELAETFADRIAVDTYSIAQIQGYLLTMKNNPLDAVSDLDNWVEEQRRQKEHILEIKRKRRLDAKQRKKDEQAAMASLMGGMSDGFSPRGNMMGLGSVAIHDEVEEEEADQDGEDEAGEPQAGSDGDHSIEMVTPPQEDSIVTA